MVTSSLWAQKTVIYHCAAPMNKILCKCLRVGKIKFYLGYVLPAVWVISLRVSWSLLWNMKWFSLFTIDIWLLSWLICQMFSLRVPESNAETGISIPSCFSQKHNTGLKTNLILWPVITTFQPVTCRAQSYFLSRHHQDAWEKPHFIYPEV